MKRIAIRHFMFDSTERKTSPRMLAASGVQRMCKSFPYSTFDNTMTTKIFHPLLAMIASATDRELAKQVQYLKEENKILRARIPGQIHTKPAERAQLVKLGKVIGKAIEELISIVSPSTFYRWLHQEDKQEDKNKNPKGGQRKPREIRELVITIAKTTGFGYTRIIGELRKLGIKKISRQTIRNILKEEGMEPGPDRTSDTWDEFIKRHGATLWGCDFFSVKAVTARGIQTLFMLVFLNLKTREAIVSKSTAHPDSGWVVEQTELFLDQTLNRDEKPSIIMHDLDTKFTKEFTAKLKEKGVRTNPLPKASPNLNGRCERVIETIKLECLRKFIIFGKRHLEYLVSEFCEYYNKHRAHMEREHLPPIRTEPEEVISLKMEQIEVKSYVGGLVKSFAKKAA
jgi:putative transposase